MKLLLILTLFSFKIHAVGITSSQEYKNLLEDEKNTISIFSQSVKSVVNVSIIRKVSRNHFFSWDQIEVPAGQGSGFIWDDEGHIVTNYHVIRGGTSFLISFHKDKKQYKAKLVGSEPKKDIAVLKLIESPKSLTPVSMGDCSVEAF